MCGGSGGAGALGRGDPRLRQPPTYIHYILIYTIINIESLLNFFLFDDIVQSDIDKKYNL